VEVCRRQHLLDCRTPSRQLARRLLDRGTDLVLHLATGEPRRPGYSQVARLGRFGFSPGHGRHVGVVTVGAGEEPQPYFYGYLGVASCSELRPTTLPHTRVNKAKMKGPRSPADLFSQEPGQPPRAAAPSGRVVPAEEGVDAEKQRTEEHQRVGRLRSVQRRSGSSEALARLSRKTRARPRRRRGLRGRAGARGPSPWRQAHRRALPPPTRRAPATRLRRPRRTRREP